MKTKAFFLFVLLVLLSIAIKAQTPIKKNKGTLWFCWENDTYLKTDHGFTNGLKLTWISPPTENPKSNSWLGWMPSVQKPGFDYMFSYSLRQNVFTPDDLIRTDLDENDRPYAGYLTFEAGIHSLGENRAASFSLSLGVVGPLSLAEHAQNFVHNNNNAPMPQGWHNQLSNELAVQVMYENRRRLSLFGAKKGLGFDIIPRMAGGLGNVYTYCSAGFQARLGWNLPHDFGLPHLRPGGASGVGLFDLDPIRAGPGFGGIYLFFALDGQLVLRNIFLDGNTFRDSHSVKKDVMTGNYQAGLGIKINYLNLNVTYVRWSRLYESQTYRQSYLITNLSYSF